MPVFCLCIVYAGFLYCVSVFVSDIIPSFICKFHKNFRTVFQSVFDYFFKHKIQNTPELCPGKSGFHKLIAINGKLFDAETFVFFDYILCSSANPLQVIELSAACAVL